MLAVNADERVPRGRTTCVVQDAVDFGEDLLNLFASALTAPNVHDERRLDAVKRRRDGCGGASVRNRSKS